MHSVVDFQVDWTKLLFKSRPQIPCRDINHVATSVPRRDIYLTLCSFLLMSRHRSLVATSLYAFAGFNWLLMMSRHQSLVVTSAQVFCRCQMVAPDVAKSIFCRDINLMNCSFQLMSSVVATSILYRDIASCLCRFHWLFLVSRHQSSVATTAYVTAVSSFQTYHSFTALFLSRPPSLVATSTFVATSRCCRDIIPLVSAQSSAAYLVIPVATCIKFPSIFLMSRPHNWTVQTPKLQH